MRTSIILHGHIVKLPQPAQRQGKLAAEDESDAGHGASAGGEQPGDRSATSSRPIWSRSAASRIQGGDRHGQRSRLEEVIEALLRRGRSIARSRPPCKAVQRAGQGRGSCRVKGMKREISAELAEETARHGVDRLTVDEPNRLQTFTREMEMIENLSRIYRLCRKIARTSNGVSRRRRRCRRRPSRSHRLPMTVRALARSVDEGTSDWLAEWLTGRRKGSLEVCHCSLGVLTCH